MGSTKSQLRTQKARGVYELRRGACYYFQDYFGFARPPVGKISYAPHTVLDVEFPAFVRPCPMRPRHGFVDSRVVKSTGELLRVYGETMREEIDGEMIIMRPYTARYSAVANNAGVTWGLGNDGATGAGKQTVFIPAPKSVKGWNNKLVIGQPEYIAKKFGIEDCAYVEIVEDDMLAHAVQVRDGPGQQATLDFIPQETTVKRVITIHDLDGSNEPDLLKWEAYVLENAKPGTVFDFHKGALSSHYAVHAVCARMPVMCSRSVSVGDTLVPEDEGVKPLMAGDVMKIAATLKTLYPGTFYAKLCDKKRRKDDQNYYNPGLETLNVAVASLHASSYWDNSPHLLWLRAFSALTIARYVLTSCIGEARYYMRFNDYHNQYDTCEYEWDYREALDYVSTPWESIDPNYAFWEKDRTKVYQKLYPLSTEHLIKVGEGALADHEGGWHERCGSYGGKPWADACSAALKSMKLIQQFIDKPALKRWNEVWMETNNLLHLCHNGGSPVLDKWGGTEVLDTLASAPIFGFTNGIAGELALKQQEVTYG